MQSDQTSSQRRDVDEWKGLISISETFEVDLSMIRGASTKEENVKPVISWQARSFRRLNNDAEVPSKPLDSIWGTVWGTVSRLAKSSAFPRNSDTSNCFRGLIFPLRGLKVWHRINYIWLKYLYWNILHSTSDKTVMLSRATGREPLTKSIEASTLPLSCVYDHYGFHLIYYWT